MVSCFLLSAEEKKNNEKERIEELHGKKLGRRTEKRIRSCCKEEGRAERREGKREKATAKKKKK
jgi:hypothetical protein